MWMEWLMTMLSIGGTLVFVTVNALIFALVYVKVMSSGFNRASFKPSKAANENIRFSDVLGVNEAKMEAREVVDFLKQADRLKAIGARVPRGVLLVGPPGTGKTLLAKAIANEAGVPFFALSGADFNEIFVGVGASRIRKLYAEARKHKAAIVFIDEIDALARARTTNMFGGQESNNTLNAFLVELDGFGREGTVVTIGATNLEESLDVALLRPGRFDRKIHVGLPSLEGRKSILDHYMARVKAEPALDLTGVARATATMSGADLASLVNEASIMAVRAGRRRVGAEDLAKAIERMGIGQVQSKTIGPAEREVIATHEAGHAIVEFFSISRKRMMKVSIIPTGRSALGYTWAVYPEDKHLIAREEYLAEIAMLFGGRMAEELAFGPSRVTSGAACDLVRASKLAETMVWDLGFAPGYPGCYRDMPLSEDTKRELDAAVGRILAEGRATAHGLLATHDREFNAVAKALLAHEVLDGPEIERLLGGGTAVTIEHQPGSERPGRCSDSAGAGETNAA